MEASPRKTSAGAYPAPDARSNGGGRGNTSVGRGLGSQREEDQADPRHDEPPEEKDVAGQDEEAADPIANAESGRVGADDETAPADQPDRLPPRQPAADRADRQAEPEEKEHPPG